MKQLNTKLLITGFTLTELIMAIIILGILATIAMPSFQESIADNRLDTKTNTIIHSLKLARSEAIKRGVAVTVCPSNTGTSCVGSDMAQGWIVFTDPANPGIVDPNGADATAGNADDEIIIEYQTPSGGGTLTAQLVDASDTDTAISYMRFSSQGFILEAMQSVNSVNQFAQQLPDVFIQPQDNYISQLILGLLPIQNFPYHPVFEHNQLD